MTIAGVTAAGMTPAGSIGPEVRVLVAEDEPHLGTILEQFLQARGMVVTTVRDGMRALDLMRLEQYDVALLDIKMPGLDGLEVLRQVRQDASPPEVIIITGHGTVDTAISALRLGAYDYLSKPYRMAEIEALVRRASEKRALMLDNARLHALQARASDGAAAPTFITQYAPLKAMLALLEPAARSEGPVLLSGESGTGRGLAARLVHHWSGRARQPFVALDCATASANLVEAELFGVEADAPVPIAAHRTGLLELAAGGTLLLERVSALDVGLQARLLRTFESGSFYRMGGSQKIRLQVRLTASTSRDLLRLATTGGMRDDFVEWLSASHAQLPPLRERLTDVVPLAEHFLAVAAAPSPPRLTGDAVSALERYRWPGNVRELRHVMQRVAMLATNGLVEGRDLPLGTDPASRPTPAQAFTLSELERRHIEAVLTRTSWHQGRASELLGISPKTLYRKIREFGFQRPGRNRSEEDE